MNRRGGTASLAIVISALASFAGSRPCLPFRDVQNACCAGPTGLYGTFGTVTCTAHCD